VRLLAYVRVSTEEQAERGHSLSMQPDFLRGWCERNGHELVDVIADEGVSASVALRKRKGGAVLLQRLAEGEAEGVIALRLDRLFRSARDGLWFVEEFTIAHGVSLFVVEGAVDTSTPAGWLACAMQLVAAQYARLIDAQRGREVNTALRRAGRVFGGVPFGCVVDAGKLYRSRDTWPLRERIVQLRDSTPVGARRRMSLAQISDRLFDEGVRAPGGGKRWSKATLRNVLDTHDQFDSLPWLDHAEQVTAVTPPTV
jgi:site-specific DNA recombinase